MSLEEEESGRKPDLYRGSNVQNDDDGETGAGSSQHQFLHYKSHWNISGAFGPAVVWVNVREVTLSPAV